MILLLFLAAIQEPLEAGQKLFKEGDLEAAVAAFTKVIDADPKSAAAFEARGEANHRLGEAEKAEQDFTQALELKPTAGRRAWRGIARLRGPNARDAARDFDAALDMDRDCALALAGRAQIALAEGEVEEADEVASRAIRIDPKQAEGYFVRALASAATNSIPLARRDLDRAVEADPNHVDARRARVQLLMQAGDQEGALRDMDRLVRLRPKSDAFYALRGGIRGSARDHEAAVADLSKAIELNPKQADYYLRRAGLYRSGLKQHDKAIQDYTRALELDPKNSDALTGRGYAHARLKDFKAAGRDLARAYEVRSDDPWGAYNLACFHGLRAKELKDEERARAVDEAFEWLQEARAAGYLELNCGCHGSNLEHLRTDGDLDPLHDDKRWNAASAPEVQEEK